MGTISGKGKRFIDVEACVLERGEALSVSRRSFVELAVGAIAALPVVSGGFAVPFVPERAYATETESNTAKVIVAKSYEAGIVVADMVDGKKAPVPNAEVKVKSLFNGEVLAGKTNASGVLLADIRKLAKKETVNGVDRYSFDADISVDLAEYRKFHARRITVEGAHGVLIPTRKLSGEKLYPVGVSFDDWDVLYTKNQFCVSNANDVKHTLAVELSSESDEPLTLSLVHVASKKVVVSKEGIRPKSASATCEIRDFMLLEGHESALPVSGDFRLEIEQGDTAYRMPIGLTACSAPAGASKPASTKMTLAPFDTATMKPQIIIPKGVPLIGGDKLQIWTPDLPVEIMYNPFGYFKIAFKSEDRGYKSKDGKPDPNAWKSHPRKTFAQQWQDAADARDKMMKSVGDARRREGTFKKAGFTSNLAATANLSFMLAGRWSSESGLWRGQMGAQCTLAFAYSYAQQFMAGPVPLVVEFALNSSLTFGVYVTVSTPEVFTPSKYSMDYGSTGVSMTIMIVPSISLGIGVKGVLSASIQGLASFTLFLNNGSIPPNATKEMTNPRYVVGLKAQANVVVQAFLFTITHNLWEWNKPAFYDSWKPNQKTQSAMAAQSDEEDGSWDTILGNLDDVSIISEEDIADEAEFELIWEDVDISEYGDNWESVFEEYNEEDAEEGSICWGNGMVGSGSWSDSASDDESFYFIVNEDGSISGGGSWDGEPISTQSSQKSEPAGPMKVEERVAEYVTDDGIPYQMTSFELVATDETQTRRAFAAGAPGDSKTLAAGSSPALTAPSSGGASLSAQAEGVLYRRGKAMRKSGKITNGATKLNRPDVSSPSKLAIDVGLVPQCDNKIIEGVFSDPRAKVVKLYDSMYLFRIAAVDIQGADGKTLNRTRIVAQKLVATGQKAEAAFVLDFRHTFNAGSGSGEQLTARDDLFDYDFAIRSREPGSYITELDLFIISGKRANGDKTTIGQAASDQVFTHAICQFTNTSKKLEITYGFSAPTSAPAFNATGNANLKYHNFSCPQLVMAAKGDLIATYLDRAADSVDKVLTSEASVGLGLCFASRYTAFKAANISNLVGIKDSSVYDMTMLEAMRVEVDPDKVHRHYIPITLKGEKETEFYLLTTRTKSIFDGNGKEDPRVLRVAKLSVSEKETDPIPERFVYWPEHNSKVLASVGGKLKQGELRDFGTATPKISWSDAGPENFSISNFGTDATGNFIYWPATYEGSPGFSYASAADDPSKATSLPEIELHRVMACKLRKGTFSDPFVFAEVAHDMDTLQIVGSQKSEAMAFISCDLRDAKKGKADIWYTSMPNAKCANVIGVEVLSNVVHPGETAVFNITVRNDGNTYLSGFTAQLFEKDGKKPLSDVKLTFSKDTLVESGYNPADSKGALQNVEDDYALAPGKTSVYRIKFTIPSDWKGEKNISVVAKDAVVSSSDSVKKQGVTTQAETDDSAYDDSDAVEYVVGGDDGDYGEEGMPFDVVSVQAEDNLDEYVEGYDYKYSDAPVKTRVNTNRKPGSDSPEGNGTESPSSNRPSSGGSSSGGSAPNGSSSGGSSSSGSSTGKSSSGGSSSGNAPKTGDPFGPFAGLLGVAAIAGGAMAAYSARRVANEQGDTEQR